MSGAGLATLLRGPYGLPCGARADRGLAKLGYASNNASPDPITPALLSHAKGIANPAPLTQLAGWRRGVSSNHKILWEADMNTFITQENFEERLRSAISVAWAAFGRKVGGA